MDGLMAMLLVLVIGALVAGLYMVPTVVAVARRRPNPMPVVVINVLLGWTLLGWAAALAMAFHTPVAGVAVPLSPPSGPQ